VSDFLINQNMSKQILNIYEEEAVNEMRDAFVKNAFAKNKKPLIVVCGATASGKTALAVDWALQLGTEVISADSRQVYRFFDIGTAKVTTEEMRGVKHYLIDVVRPDESFTAADFKRRATEIIDSLHASGKIPIIAGGTGLYIDALCKNFDFDRIKANSQFRLEMEEFLKNRGALTLWNLLNEKSPELAEKIHFNNSRYVIRALEKLEFPLVESGKQTEETPYQVFFVGLHWPREVLYERINARVSVQVEEGLIDEVKNLLAMGFSEELPSMRSIGYQELFPYLRGECDLESALNKIRQNTRNYAKRQYTWFGKNGGVLWVSRRASV
jgi:tRNA dimethylallyltransferase